MGDRENAEPLGNIDSPNNPSIENRNILSKSLSENELDKKE